MTKQEAFTQEHQAYQFNVLKHLTNDQLDGEDADEFMGMAPKNEAQVWSGEDFGWHTDKK